MAQLATISPVAITRRQAQLHKHPGPAARLHRPAHFSGSYSTWRTRASSGSDGTWSAVEAVLFDMDGVLCDSEHVSRQAACEVMRELYGLEVEPEEFTPFTGRGEAAFLGGVAQKHGAPFEVESCKAKFFSIYKQKYAVPGAGIGCEGALELVAACREAGLRTAVASSADRVKVDANLSAAGIPLDLFDAIVSADAFEKARPFGRRALARQGGVQRRRTARRARATRALLRTCSGHQSRPARAPRAGARPSPPGARACAWPSPHELTRVRAGPPPRMPQLKPSPDIFLAAAAGLGVARSACVVIEDAVAGVQAARAAGMRVIGVTTSLPLAALEAAGPDAILPGIAHVTLDQIASLRWRPGLQPAAAA
eukprot:scaffold1.g5793.t1